MKKNRIRSKTKNRYKRRMKDVIKGFSRKVLVYKKSIKSECPNCYFDKMTGRSSGKCRWTAVEATALQAEYEAANPPTYNPDNPAASCSTTTTYMYKYFVKGRCPVCHGKGYLETRRKKWVHALVTWDPSQRGTGNQLVYTPAGAEGSTIVQLKTDPKHYDLFKNAERLVVDDIECKLSKPPNLRGLGTEATLIITAFTTEKVTSDPNEVIKDYNND